MIIAIMPGCSRLFLIPVVSQENTHRQIFLRPNYNLARFSHFGQFSVRSHKLYIKQRICFSHGTDFRRIADQIADQQSGFRLTESFHNRKSRRLFKLMIYFRIQRLACRSGMPDTGQVKPGQIFFDHKAVHSRRRAECCYLILLEQRQDIVGIKAIKVIHENCRFAHPLPVQLAPKRFSPACIGNGQVQPVGIHAMPVFRRNEMSQRIFIAMLCHLRITRGAGAEEHNHGIVAAGTVLTSVEFSAVHQILFVKVPPSGSISAHHDFQFKAGRCKLRFVYALRRLAVRRADDGFDSGRLETVFKILC